jgi:hypothetical protein
LQVFCECTLRGRPLGALNHAGCGVNMLRIRRCLVRKDIAVIE